MPTNTLNPTGNARQAALCLLLLLSHRSTAQFIWAGAITGPSITAHSVTSDYQGNVISAGQLALTGDLDPGTAIYPVESHGEFDGYIQKLSPNGDFLWGFGIGGPTMDWITGVCADANGNILVTGRFESTADFDPGPDVSTLVALEGDDAFVAKYSASGIFQWARAISGSNDQRGYALDTDAEGNIFATGSFRGTVDLDPGPNELSVTAAQQEDLYILKLDGEGTLLWARNIGGSLSQEGRALNVDQAGNVIVAGLLEATVDMDPGPDVVTIDPDGYDCFILKLDGDGLFIWARNLGGYDENDPQYTVSTDAVGNIYAASTFYGVNDLDPGSGVEFHGVEGQARLFVVKLDPSGNLVWAKDQDGYDLDALGSAVDASGRLYLCGTTYSSFIRYMDQNGDITYTAPNSLRENRAIALDATGNVLVAGGFSNTVDMDPGPGYYELQPNGSYNAFVLKWGTEYVAVPERSSAVNLQVYPVPFTDRLTMNTDHGSVLQVRVHAADGRWILQRSFSKTLELDLSGVPAGCYALEIWSGDRRLDSRVVSKVE